MVIVTKIPYAKISRYTVLNKSIFCLVKLKINLEWTSPKLNWTLLYHFAWQLPLNLQIFQSDMLVKTNFEIHICMQAGQYF